MNIGNDVWIGEGALILSGVTIGDGAVIGARSVVSKDIPPYAIAAGNPCRILKYRFPEEKISELLKIKWWNWETDKITSNANYLMNTDINVFINKFSK